MSSATDIAPSHAELLRTFLAERDAPCPSCGYNLHALPANRCPECGLAIALQLQLAEPRIAGFVFGLVGLAAGAGFGWLIFVFLLYRMFTKGGWFPPALEFASILVMLVVETPMLLAWIVLRRRIRRWPRKVLWLVGVIAWAMSISLASIFLVLVT